MSKRCYYEVLEISRQATDSEIKKSYRRLAVQFHPDKNPGDKTAEERFKEASEAYEILSNPEKRSIYDQFGHQGLAGAGFGGGNVNVDDIFSSFGDIFEDFFGFSGRQGNKKRRARRGNDLRFDLNIEFRDAAFGCEKEITVKKNTSCESCDGRGYEEGGISTCSMCQGHGQVRHSQGFFTISTPCPQCQGQGARITKPCTVCKAQGHVKTEKKLSVKVPPGVDNGVKLLIHHEGESGSLGGEPGDLYVFINVKEDRVFVRKGDDIEFTLNVPMITATLGGVMIVPTLEGDKEVEVKRGTQPNDTLILKGMGIANLRSGRRGNQKIIFRVQIPTALSAEQEQILNQLAETMKNDSVTISSSKKKKRGLFR